MNIAQRILLSFLDHNRIPLRIKKRIALYEDNPLDKKAC
jgi:hypothetical protein